MSGKQLDLNDPQQPYLQVAAHLREAIHSGALPVGERLKSVRELGRDYGVSAGTVQQALRLLKGEGLVMSWQGRGTFVRDRSTDEGATPEVELGALDIMQRLDVILDRIERLEEQVATLEGERPTGQKDPRRDV